MKCFNCGYPMDKNDLSNCKVCGSKYPVVCPSCDGHNPMHAMFCMSCGNDLSSAHESIKPIIESRKNVGVLFADVSGFTKLSKMLDPEELRELINECFQYITRPVYELEGTIDKYIGDCVMVVFGNEYTHPDDSFRTIQCAIEMMKLIDEFSQEKIGKLNMKLDLSIGVNYGLVVTGNVGNLYESDYTVLGDTVNIAQRLQTSAKPGEILASEDVYLDTKDHVHYGSKKSIKVKNIDKNVIAYQPISLRQETILDAQYIVKRDKELALLEEHYYQKEISYFNLIIAPSGVGKTTLVKKYISTLDPSIRKVWINASPIFKDKPYYALSKIIS
ncbi:MAG: guanylate cyclase, partial [Firmicutes bacterium]|nr:guanylate cyclase [Bacillota bacterium]